MKKFLLIGALAIAAIANAQRADLRTAQKVQFGKEPRFIETTIGAFEGQDPETFMAERRALKAAKYAGCDEYFVDGSFHLGIYEGLSGYPYAVILMPYLDSVVYQNTLGATNWLINGKTMAENQDHYTTRYGVNGEYYLPETTDHDYVFKGKTYKIKGSIYGIGASDQFACSALESKAFNNGTENAFMTLCGMYTDTLFDGNEYAGDDMWMVGGSIAKDENLYGTNMHPDSLNHTETIDTIGIYVDNLATMKIEQILFPIYNANTTKLEQVIPSNAELRVAIFPITDKGIHFNDTIASTVMTSKDFVNAGAEWGTIGTLHAKFYEKDIFGEDVAAPIWITGSFYVQLTNFNESGCSFGMYCDFFNQMTGTTILQHKGKFGYRASHGRGDNYGQNLAVSFDAYFPTLYCYDEVNELKADKEEGPAYYIAEDGEEYNALTFAPNVNPSEWEIESDEEWIQAVVDDSHYAADPETDDYAGLVPVQFVVEALPDGVDFRSGVVTIYADGVSQEFTIKQGTDPTEGIHNIKAQNDNKLYNVLGMEVNEDYKGVVIRNGQKFVR
jgi:hypothetical protein